MNKMVKQEVPVLPQETPTGAVLSKILLTTAVMAVLNTLCGLGIFCVPEDFQVRFGDTITHLDLKTILNFVAYCAIFVFRINFLNSTKMPKWLQNILTPVINIFTKSK